MIKKITFILLIATTLGATKTKLHRYGSWRHGVYFLTEDRFQYYITWMLDYFQWQNDQALVNIGITKYKWVRDTQDPDVEAKELAEAYGYDIKQDRGPLPNVEKSGYYFCESNSGGSYSHAYIVIMLDDEKQRMVDVLVECRQSYIKTAEELTLSIYLRHEQ